MRKINKNECIKIIMFIIFIVIMAIASVFAVPFVKLLATHEGRIKISQFVKSFGIFGPIIFMLMQMLQVIVALIPGEPFEIVGGILFGAFGGLVISLIGVLLGTIIVFYLVKFVGQPLVSSLFDNKKISKLKILNDEKKLETLVFILFLIPGTPKDILTYIVPLTKIKPLKYFFYSTIARIPSVISSTFVGANIGKGNWISSVVVFILTALLGLFGILYNEKVINNVKKKHDIFRKNG